MNNSLNIILFGQTGSGKSSVINLIAGREIARVSNGAAGCTLSFELYTFHINGRTYCIWDTVGLNEPETDLDSVGKAVDLIHGMTSRGGVDLLLFCVRAPRITATSQANYRLFYEVLCRSRVPIAFVITHLENEPDMERWWERNVNRLEERGLKAAGHACVTALLTHSKYQESRNNITRLLEGHDSAGRFNMPPLPWLTEYVRSLGLFRPLKWTKETIIEYLVVRCEMDRKVAEAIAPKLEDEA